MKCCRKNNLECESTTQHALSSLNYTDARKFGNATKSPPTHSTREAGNECNKTKHACFVIIHENLRDSTSKFGSEIRCSISELNIIAHDGSKLGVWNRLPQTNQHYKGKPQTERIRLCWALRVHKIHLAAGRRQRRPHQGVVRSARHGARDDAVGIPASASQLKQTWAWHAVTHSNCTSGENRSRGRLSPMPSQYSLGKNLFMAMRDVLWHSSHKQKRQQARMRLWNCTRRSMPRH